MASFIELPIETLGSIFSYADKRTRKTLRLTCQLLANVGEQWVFQEVRLSPTIRSYERVEKIMETRRLSQLVTKIDIDIRKWDPYRATEGYESDSELESGEFVSGKDTHVLPERLLSIFGHFQESPKIRSIVFRFHSEVNGPKYGLLQSARHHGQFRRNSMKQVISSLVSAPRLPRELAIQDLANVNETDSAVVAMIAKVLGGLQSLRLNIANEHDEGNGENDLYCEEPHLFFPELPSFWLKPTMANLRHLTLYSSLYFGFYPKCDFRGIHFPHLETLSFGNYTFVHDSQLDWILSHGATLTELYLDDCPLLFEVSIGGKDRTYLDPGVFQRQAKFGGDYWATYRTRWCDYFRAFRDGLPLLRHFRYGHGRGWWDENNSCPFELETDIEIVLNDESYMVFCDGFGPSPYMAHMIYRGDAPQGRDYEDGEPLFPTEEDETALRELLLKIGQTPPVPLRKGGYAY